MKKQREHDHGFEAEAIRRLELGLKAKGEVLERSAYEGSFVICGPADVNQLIRSGCTFFFSDDIFNSDPKMLGLPRNEHLSAHDLKPRKMCHPLIMAIAQSTLMLINKAR